MQDTLGLVRYVMEFCDFCESSGITVQSFGEVGDGYARRKRHPAILSVLPQ